MTLPTFFRGTLPDLWIGLSFSEALFGGGSATSVKDTLGVSGQVSLVCVATGVPIAVPMAAWEGSGADLGGKTPLAPLVGGEYHIRGSVLNSHGDVSTIDLGFLLVDGPAPENGTTAILPDGQPLPSVGVASTGPLSLSFLRSGLSVAFPAPSAPTLVFPPSTMTTEVRL